MDRIEYEANAGRRDVRNLVLRRLCTSRYVHIYYVAVVAISVFVVLTRPEGYGRHNYENLAIVIVPALMLPFLLGLSLARRAFNESYRQGKKITFLDQEGYGQKADTYEVKFKWETVDSIQETKKYIFVKKHGWVRLAIYKYLLPHETVSAIKELLANVPVETKKLLPDEKLK